MGDLRIAYSNLLDHKGDFGQCIEVVNQVIDDFPKSFFSNSKTIGLTLNRNKLSSLPNELKRLKKLERLDLSNNQFETMPEVIGDLENLRYLNMSKNKLKSLPRDIMYLRKLEEIVLDDNLFEDFPEVLFQCTIEDVTMRRNKMKVLPPGISGMKNLKSLVVSGNMLTSLPVELTELPQLTEVYASDNKIKGMPENFCSKSRSLKKLVLHQNPLIYPSAISAGKGVAAMRDYEKKHPRPNIPVEVEEQPNEVANDQQEEKQADVPEGGDQPAVNGEAHEETPGATETSEDAGGETEAPAAPAPEVLDEAEAMTESQNEAQVEQPGVDDGTPVSIPQEEVAEEHAAPPVEEESEASAPAQDVAEAEPDQVASDSEKEESPLESKPEQDVQESEEEEDEVTEDSSPVAVVEAQEESSAPSDQNAADDETKSEDATEPSPPEVGEAAAPTNEEEAILKEQEEPEEQEPSKNEEPSQAAEPSKAEEPPKEEASAKQEEEDETSNGEEPAREEEPSNEVEEQPQEEESPQQEVPTKERIDGDTGEVSPVTTTTQVSPCGEETTPTAPQEGESESINERLI